MYRIACVLRPPSRLWWLLRGRRRPDVVSLPAFRVPARASMRPHGRGGGGIDVGGWWRPVRGVEVAS